MSYEDKKTETEILSADEQKVREMCSSLQKIDAPKDFDFKLKARIAKANPRDFQPRFGFAFRYALPALALIFALGLLVYNSGLFSASKNIAVIAETSPETKNPSLPQNTAVANFPSPEAKPQSNESIAVLPPNQVEPKAPENEIVESKTKNTKIENKHQSKTDDLGGSALKSQKKAEVIQPNPEKPQNIPPNPQNLEKVNPMSVKDVLSTNGINAEFENGKWTVKSVTANSVGESSGVKENDVVEAIDNQPLSADTVFNKTAAGKTLTVTRNGDNLIIRLRTK